VRKWIVVFVLALMGAMSMNVSESHAKTATAIFAGGCFWCMESEFQTKPGVLAVTSGYTGGAADDARYDLVSAKKTQHVEAVEVAYDPAKVSYAALLDIFWSNIDPTDAGGQFYDRGAHYQTAIFYGNEEEKQLAETSKLALAKKLGAEIATRIVPRTDFYAAEEEHQDYFEKAPAHYDAYVRGSRRKETLKKIHQIQ